MQNGLLQELRALMLCVLNFAPDGTEPPQNPVLDRAAEMTARQAWTLEQERVRLQILFPSGVLPWELRRVRQLAELRWSPLTALATVFFGEYYPLESEQVIAEDMEFPLPLLATLAMASEGHCMHNTTVRALRARLLEGLRVSECLALKLMDQFEGEEG
jgi:hypothetical protein